MLYLALIVLLSCAAILQYHSILWWQDQIGHIGIFWSLVIEVLAAWWWFGFRWKRWLGLVASILILAGPLHHVSAPLYKTRIMAETQRTAISNRLESVREQIKSQQKILQGYRERSQERLGWRDVQEKASRRLQELRSRERQLLGEKSSAVSKKPVALELITILQLTALVLYQIGTISAVLYLSGRYQSWRQRQTTPSEAPQEDPRQELAKRVKREMEKKGLSWYNMAQQLDVSKSEVRRVVRHANRGAGEEGHTATKRTWKRVQKYFNGN